jgi:radical SAM protein with 4Fe4S-binding SPASM domain
MKFLYNQYHQLSKRYSYLKIIDLIRQQWLSIPREIALELTNDCNLKCAKCPTYETNRSRGIFPQEVFEKLMNDIQKAPRGKTNLTFTGAGEPSLHPGIISYVQRAKLEPKISEVKLITNALDLSPDLIDGLVLAKINSINVSLDTVDPANYLKINRVDGLERVIKNIDYLAAHKGSTKIHLKVTLYKEDPKFISQIKEKFTNKFDSIRFTGLHNWLGLRGKQTSTEERGVCHYPFYQAQILWDGQITLCCHDCMEGKINMGNINDLSLSDYWRSGLMIKQRWAQIKGDLDQWPVCKSCDAYKYDYERKL